MQEINFSKYIKLLKLSPFFIGIAYLLGFIIINSYCPIISTSGSNLVNARYLSSGTLYILLMVTNIAILLFVVKMPTDAMTTKSIFISFDYFFYSLIIVFITANTLIKGSETKGIYFSCLLTALMGIYVVFYHIKINKGLKIFSLLIILIASFICLYLANRGRGAFYTWYLLNSFYLLIVYGRLGDKLFDQYEAVYFGLLLVGSIALYGSRVYETIKPNFGGGSPEQVQFYLSDEKRNDTLSFDLELKENDKITPTVKLIYETDGYYLIKSKNKYIRLDKNIVQGYSR
jgi:hypothetical protein